MKRRRIKASHNPGTKRAPRWFRRARKWRKEQGVARKRMIKRREVKVAKFAAYQAALIARAKAYMTGRGHR